ncbi:ABC transporter ATP-binding protein [Streptosporangium sp. NPDC087985]|uniref:ABC transporter ATP-binding protein n=1 Tax=Streptosporangium sp. NPDC087985 TaxID=3366196 RepID=UPI00380165EB
MISVSGLTKRYDDRTVVDDVTFTLEPGTITGFLGANGAGKSTTLRMITGLVPSSGGTALIGGRPYADLPNPPAVLGALLDASAVHPGRTGLAHLQILADTLGVPAGRVDELLEQVDLTGAAKRRIGGYSLGMRQRLGIAAALLADPDVLVFDEPSNGLDPEGIRWLRELLRERAARGGTVLLSSHLLNEVEHTVDRLLVISAGRIMADAPIGELLHGNGTVVRAADPAALAADLLRTGLPAERGTDGLLTVRGATPAQVGAVAAQGGHALIDLRPTEHGLEDLFFQLTAAA